MYQTIRYEKNGNIGIATINRPEALNALNSTVISELEQLISEVEKDAELGAFIITGEGRSFVAGADIGEQSTMDVAAGRKWGQRGSALFRRIEKLEIPTIAAVNGFALGGGCELAMSCDIILAAGPNAEGKGGAKFGQPEVGLGITPGFSGTQRLPRRVGIAKAKELALQMYNGGIMIVQAFAGGAANGVYQAVEGLEEGKYAMGAATGQFELSPDRIIASHIIKTDEYFATVCQQFTEGQLPSGIVKAGLADGATGIRLSPNIGDLVPQEILDAMEEIEQKLISGEIVPPTTEEELANYLAEINA